MVATRREGKDYRAKVVVCNAKKKLRAVKSKLFKQLQKADRDKERRCLLLRLLSTKDEETCEMLRMNKVKFAELCEVLEFAGGLQERPSIPIKERVAIFLIMIGHGTSSHIMKHMFLRSASTIHSCFREVLDCILQLQTLFLAQLKPVPRHCQAEPWCNFEGCVGVVDVCQFTQSKLYLVGACGSDFRFSYIQAGLDENESSAVKLFSNAYKGGDDLHPQTGTYYIVPGKLYNLPGFLAPYHLAGTLEEIRGGRKPTRREVFNHKHRAVCKSMELAFELVKQRFHILTGVHEYYQPEKQVKILAACCLLHNFCFKATEPLEDFMQLSLDDADDTVEVNRDVPTAGYDEALSRLNNGEWKMFRDSIAAEIWPIEDEV